jgi:hypothetical protein
VATQEDEDEGIEDAGRLEDDPNMSSMKELPPEEDAKREELDDGWRGVWTCRDVVRLVPYQVSPRRRLMQRAVGERSSNPERTSSIAVLASLLDKRGIELYWSARI